MKKIVLPVLGLAIASFALPAAAECGWSKQTTEKPKEQVEKPSA